MSALPSGTVTFLMTDIEGSTSLQRDHPEEMALAFQQHDAILARVIAGNNGHLIKSRGEGDSAFAAFSFAPDAVRAAYEVQRALADETWPANTPLRVRIALDTGEAVPREGDYRATPVNRCARLRSVVRGCQVLLTAAVYDSARGVLPEGASVRDHGQVRLRDFPSERVFELVLPWVTEPFPRLEASAALHNVPAQLTSFIGRSRELGEVRTQLSGPARLLTLVGPGGCGKTRLAIEAVSDMGDDYPDGIWFVDLSPLTDPVLVLQAVAAPLGVREDAGKPLLDALREQIEGRAMLLLLDNCEQVREGVFQLVEDLLRASPRGRVLATSRMSLGVTGEVIWQVPPLSVPPDGDATSGVERLREFESVRLFEERARSARRTFGVTEENASSVGELCRSLDGIPLAIELAAARTRVFAPREIQAHLNESLDFLASASPAVQPRHRSLRATLDWSYGLLAEHEQLVLQGLSVFSGGFTLEAAEGVCVRDGRPASEVMDALAFLVDHSLVVVVEGVGETRYRLLEAIRLYARERLAAGAGAYEVSKRHLAYYTGLAQRAAPELQGPDQAVWLQRLDQEHGNFRVALDWAAESGDGTGATLAAALCQFWMTRGHYREALAYIKSALSLCSGQDGVRARLLNTAGVLTCSSGDCEAALVFHQDSLRIYRELDDRPGVAHVLSNLGRTAHSQGDLIAARDHYLSALATYREIGHLRGVATVLIALGAIGSDQREWAWAEDHLQEGLTVARETGNRRLEGDALHNLGEIAYRRKANARARALLVEAIGIRREMDDRPAVAEAFECLAQVLAAEGKSEAAVRLIAASERLRKELGTTRSSGETEDELRAIGRLRQKLGEAQYCSSWEVGQSMPLQEVYDDAVRAG